MGNGLSDCKKNFKPVELNSVIYKLSRDLSKNSDIFIKTYFKNQKHSADCFWGL